MGQRTVQVMDLDLGPLVPLPDDFDFVEFEENVLRPALERLARKVDGIE